MAARSQGCGTVTTSFDDEDEELSLRTADVHTLLAGVSVPWLMKVFRMGRGTVERKLRGLRPVGQGKHNTPLYDLSEASSYLVTPKFDIAEYIRNAGPESLPEHLRSAYWEAKLREQRYKEKAGDLWRSDLILERIMEVLQGIRVKLQLTAEMVERESVLSPEQRQAVIKVSDGVQEDIYKYILGLAKDTSTWNQLGEEFPIGARDHEDII